MIPSTVLIYDYDTIIIAIAETAPAMILKRHAAPVWRGRRHAFDPELASIYENGTAVSVAGA